MFLESATVIRKDSLNGNAIVYIGTCDEWCRAGQTTSTACHFDTGAILVYTLAERDRDETYTSRDCRCD